MIDRRTLVALGGAMLAAPQVAVARGKTGQFPRGFLWGAATAGHQVEGNNAASDQWFLEQLKPTAYAEPSGDAVNSFALWGQDMDLVKALGLNSYRFSIEWARIEPVKGQFSIAMLDHYRRMIDGCIQRGLAPVVTFNHFTAPLWFGAAGGWTNAEAPDLFARFCDKAARHLAAGISHALTLNEPNLLMLLRGVLPPPVHAKNAAMLDLAAKQLGVAKFTAGNAAKPEDLETMQRIQIAAHKAGRAAIKAVRSDLPVGYSLALIDEQAVGPNSKRDAVRAELYAAWLEGAKGDDFLGIQNYERREHDANGKLPPPEGKPRNFLGAEVYAPALAGAVRYAHQVTSLPIIVTEHGVGIEDDQIRAAFIPAALAELKKAMDEGVPVKGYIHWSLLDNFEWSFGYRPKFGLVAVDRTTFKRTPKPSAHVLAGIARRNGL